MEQLELYLYQPTDSQGRTLEVGCHIRAWYGVRMSDGSLSNSMTGVVVALTSAAVIFDGTTEATRFPTTYRCCVRAPEDVERID